MKVRVMLSVIGTLVVVVSGIVIAALFYLSHGHLTSPGQTLSSGEQVTYTADGYAGLIAARSLVVLLPVLGIGIVIAGLSRPRRPLASGAFLVLAGLFTSAASPIIVAWGQPTQYQATLADGTLARMFITVGVSWGYPVFTAALLPLGLATAVFGLADAVRLRRTSRLAPVTE